MFLLVSHSVFGKYRDGCVISIVGLFPSMDYIDDWKMYIDSKSIRDLFLNTEEYTNYLDMKKSFEYLLENTLKKERDDFLKTFDKDVHDYSMLENKLRATEINMRHNAKLPTLKEYFIECLEDEKFREHCDSCFIKGYNTDILDLEDEGIRFYAVTKFVTEDK